MDDPLAAAVAAAYRSLGEGGLVRGVEGNVAAVDRAAGLVHVTATGLPARRASAEQVSLVDLATGALLAGPEPSSELPMHLALLRAGHAAVVHCHAPHANAVALVRDEIPLTLSEQAIFAGGVVAVLPYVRTGTQEMAEAVTAALADGRAVVIRHHGVVACGPTLDHAVAALLATEEAARTYLLARTIGVPAPLDTAELPALRAIGGFGVEGP